MRLTSTFSEHSLLALKTLDHFDISKYSPEKNPEEYGLDSLDFVEFVITLELDLKVELTDEEALSITTVDSAYQIFSKYKKLDK
jgi:acyl carrier protein